MGWTKMLLEATRNIQKHGDPYGPITNRKFTINKYKHTDLFTDEQFGCQIGSGRGREGIDLSIVGYEV